VVVLLCDSLPPYRVRVHRACAGDARSGTADGLHARPAGRAVAGWSQADLPHVTFGAGEVTAGRLGAPRFFGHEFRKAGRSSSGSAGGGRRPS
jgi:hypothetical protein